MHHVYKNGCLQYVPEYSRLRYARIKWHKNGRKKYVHKGDDELIYVFFGGVWFFVVMMGGKTVVSKSKIKKLYKIQALLLFFIKSIDSEKKLRILNCFLIHWRKASCCLNIVLASLLFLINTRGKELAF